MWSAPPEDLGDRVRFFGESASFVIDDADERDRGAVRVAVNRPKATLNRGDAIVL